MLQLGANKLNSTLFGSLIAGLPKLRELHLYRNLLTGPLPDIPAGSKSGFGDGGGGPPKGLSVVWLFENRFSSSIPPGLCLESLTDLRLNSNALTGLIPDEIGQCVNLKILHLQRNQLSGAIDPVYNLLKIRDLRLWHNMLDHELTDGIGNLRNMETCLLHKNRSVHSVVRAVRVQVQGYNSL